MSLFTIICSPRFQALVLCSVLFFTAVLAAEAQMGPATPPSPPISVLNHISLLFPLVSTSSSGNDTVITFANISANPESKGKAGSCTLYFYGQSASTIAPLATPSIPAGQILSYDVAVGTTTIGATTTTPSLTAVEGFTGYVIANCNFQAQGVELFTTNSASAPPTYTAISAIANPQP